MLLLIKVCSHKIAETPGLLDQGTDSPHPVQDFVVAPPTNPYPEMFAFCHQISSQIQLKKKCITTRGITKVYPFQQQPTFLLSNYTLHQHLVISSFSGTKQKQSSKNNSSSLLKIVRGFQYTTGVSDSIHRKDQTREIKYKL